MANEPYTENNQFDEQIQVKRKSPIFGMVYKDVLELDGMTRNSSIAYTALCIFASKDGRECFPGKRKLATMMHVGTSTLEQGFKTLEELGILERTHRKRPGKEAYTKTLYTLHDFEIAVKAVFGASTPKEADKGEGVPNWVQGVSNWVQGVPGEGTEQSTEQSNKQSNARAAPVGAAPAAATLVDNCEEKREEKEEIEDALETLSLYGIKKDFARENVRKAYREGIRDFSAFYKFLHNKKPDAGPALIKNMLADNDKIERFLEENKPEPEPVYCSVCGADVTYIRGMSCVICYATAEEQQEPLQYVARLQHPIKRKLPKVYEYWEKELERAGLLETQESWAI